MTVKLYMSMNETELAEFADYLVAAYGFDEFYDGERGGSSHSRKWLTVDQQAQLNYLIDCYPSWDDEQITASLRAQTGAVIAPRSIIHYRRRLVGEIAAIRPVDRGRGYGLSVAQKDLLRGLWLSGPRTSASEVARRFAEMTGRPISQPTASKYRPSGFVVETHQKVVRSVTVLVEDIGRREGVTEPDSDRANHSMPVGPSAVRPVLHGDGAHLSPRPDDPSPEEIATATAEIKRQHLEALRRGDAKHAGGRGRPIKVKEGAFS
jgi:hypothetical protein